MKNYNPKLGMFIKKLENIMALSKVVAVVKSVNNVDVRLTGNDGKHLRK